MYYYLVKTKVEIPDENTDRVKKIVEQYVVSASSVSEAEEKLKERFRDSISDISVISIQESKIIGIIE
jgi:hypothetical protein